MAGNQTDAKNAAMRALKTEQNALRNIERTGNANQIREQKRRVDTAQSAFDTAAARERDALRGTARSFF